MYYIVADQRGREKLLLERYTDDDRALQRVHELLEEGFHDINICDNTIDYHDVVFDMCHRRQEER